MAQRRLPRIWNVTLVCGLGLLLAWTMLAQAQEGSQGVLQVVATIPDLGSLVREVGGEDVAVTVLAKGTEDPHFLEARPTFIKALSQADVYIQSGLELEIGWAPLLLQQARNARVLPGAPGYIEAAEAITPLRVPVGSVDRSQGDVHAMGNPHFLTDPLQGLRVARYLQERLITLRPQQAAAFARRYATLQQRLGIALLGEALVAKYDVAKLLLLVEHQRLEAFVQAQGDSALLGGWLGRLRPYAGIKAVADHDIWPYFAQRFHLNIVEFMEPKPGLPPTTRHLQDVIRMMQAQQVPLILASAYYDTRHARFLAQHTGAKIVALAHQVGAREGTEDYLKMVEYNVQQFLAALTGG